jgi:hypothetical protein
MTTFSDPTILKFWFRGIQFAAGDIDVATAGKENPANDHGAN